MEELWLWETFDLFVFDCDLIDECVDPYDLVDFFYELEFIDSRVSSSLSIGCIYEEEREEEEEDIPEEGDIDEDDCTDYTCEWWMSKFY